MRTMERICEEQNEAINLRSCLPNPALLAIKKSIQEIFVKVKYHKQFK
jgi:hypothetical protein